MILDHTREHLYENPTELEKLFIKRRSFRKYSKREVEPNKIAEIELCANIFKSKMRFEHSRISITKDRSEFVSIINAATRGIVGGINPWLKNTFASNIIVAIVNHEGACSNFERQKRIAETAMLMEIVILKATELSLATCWMAGVNTKEIEIVCKLNPKEEVIAISTLGYPPENTGITDYDFWANRLVSRKRKAISELVFFEAIDE